LETSNLAFLNQSAISNAFQGHTTAPIDTQGQTSTDVDQVTSSTTPMLQLTVALGTLPTHLQISVVGRVINAVFESRRVIH
jgi:hypothetical protein